MIRRWSFLSIVLALTAIASIVACGGGTITNGSSSSGVAGACCDRYNACTNDTQADCTDVFVGTWHAGDCSSYNCGTETGACCQTNGGCNEMVAQSVCTGEGGVWTADDSCRDANCAPAGACCDRWNACYGVTADFCTGSIGGSWHSGACTTYNCGTETGACCLPNGGCDEMATQSACAAQKGAWTADDNCRDADCAPAGACCNAYNECTNVIEKNCTGKWHSGNCATHSCGSETGACCLPTGGCSPNVTESSCTASLGLWNGDADCDHTSCPSSWTWTIQATLGAGLNGVWGSSASDVYAVGGALNADTNKPTAGYIYHSDGSGSWTTALKTSDAEMFYAVWGASLSDVYAVGGMYNASGVSTVDAIWRYNGKSWTSQSQQLIGTVWYAVWGTSSSDVFLVGSVVQGVGVIAHWNGSAWSTTDPSGLVAIEGVYGKDSTDVYATYVNTNGIAGVLQYNGSSWTNIFQRPSDTNDQFLVGIWRSSTTVYTVGWEELQAEGPITPLIYEFLDGQWPSMPPGTSDSVGLYGVWGTSDTNIYAVGGDQSANLGVGIMLRYDTGAWLPVTLPSGTEYLSAIWGSSPADVYAVGPGWFTPSGLILHYPN
jgi:hypothetical protein